MQMILNNTMKHTLPKVANGNIFKIIMLMSSVFPLTYIVLLALENN